MTVWRNAISWLLVAGMSFRGCLFLCAGVLLVRGVHSGPVQEPALNATAENHPRKAKSSQDNGSRVVKAKPSGLLAEIDSLLRERPDLPASTVVAAGNSRIPVQGIDYEFDVQAFIENFKLKPIIGNDSAVATYRLPFQSVEGEWVLVQAEVGPTGACGERRVVIPLARITPSEMEILSEERHYRLRRPPTLYLERMDLVDQTMANVLRTWELPFETDLLGVSPDGSVLYFRPNFDIYNSTARQEGQHRLASPLRLLDVSLLSPERPTQLILATSDESYRFVDAYALVSQEKLQRIEKHPVVSGNAYAGFESVRWADKTYIIRFSFPCT